MKALVAAAALIAALSLVPSAFADRFSATVSQILAQPYQPDYVPLGLDSAFDGSVPNTLPAEDYTTGSIPDSPDYPAWPAAGLGLGPRDESAAGRGRVSPAAAQGAAHAA